MHRIHSGLCRERPNGHHHTSGTLLYKVLSVQLSCSICIKLLMTEIKPNEVLFSALCFLKSVHLPKCFKVHNVLYISKVLLPKAQNNKMYLTVSSVSFSSHLYISLSIEHDLVFILVSGGCLAISI